MLNFRSMVVIVYMQYIRQMNVVNHSGKNLDLVNDIVLTGEGYFVNRAFNYMKNNVLEKDWN
jgi:hypothetical protein